MEPKWAEENLQTIRILMERSAVYRRALAPIMLLAGAIGVATAAIGIIFHFDSTRRFAALWLGTAGIVIVGAFLVARRQAVKDDEKFWSPPTRRVARALSLPLAVGLVLSLLPIFFETNGSEINMASSVVWILFYGSALHSAGFFMPRGVKYFGLFFVVADLAFIYAVFASWLPDWLMDKLNAHWLMGFFFGVLHLAYGAYLYLTEKKNPVA